MNIADLPLDIAHIIVDIVICGATDSLDKWSATLPVIQVCRVWRSLAVPSMYSCVHFDFNYYVTSTKGTDYDRSAETNCNLICRNKFQHHVKIVDFGHEHYEKNKYMTYLLNRFIKNGIWGNNPVARTFYYNKGKRPPTIITPQRWTVRTRASSSDEEINGLDEDVCGLFMQTFRNITSIRIEETERPSHRSAIIQGLINCYGSQLSLVKFVSEGELINMSAACKLTNLEVKTYEFYYDCDLGTNLHPICPDHLQNVCLRFSFPVYFWRIFSWNLSSNKIVFENLRRLKFGSEHYTVDLHDETYYGWKNCYLGPNGQYELAFPRLTELEIANYNIAADELRYLRQAPLERLIYKGWVDNFLEDFPQIPSTVKYVSLNMSRPTNGDAFVPYFNRVFQQMNGVDVVKCKYYLTLLDTDQSGLYWPNLTHIYLESYKSIEDIVAIADHAPDLIEFTFHKNSYGSKKDERVPASLLNMKKHYSRPSNSKIYTLNIIYDNTCMDSFLDKILENLKWYWPKLHDIKITHIKR